MAVEIETILVRLLGEGSSLQKTMSDGANTVRVMTNRMYTALSRVERFAGTLVKGLGSFGLASSLRGMFNQFANLEQGQIRLNAAIRGGGHDADVLVARYTRVAESLAATTLNTKGSILGLFQQAEAAQLSGDTAEQAVRYSIALAGATGQSADAMMRTAIQLAKGHPEFARRVLNLREVKDNTELVAKITEKLNTGMSIATAEFNSANGRVERLGRALKSFGTDLGGMIAKVALPIVGMLQQVFDEFKKLEPATKQQIALVLGLTIAWLGMGPITQVLKDLLAPTFRMLQFLAIELPLMAARVIVWLAWKTILGLAAVAVFTLAGFLALVNIGETLMAVKTAVVSAAMLVWKGIIWLVNGALTVMNVLLAPATLIAVAATVAVLGTAFFTVYAAVASVVQAFRAIPNLGGPIAAVTNMLGEWWTMLKEIFLVAQNDAPRAWEMMKAAFALAVGQIRDLWPPLWRFIQEGFGLVWEAVSESFKSRMLSAAVAVMRATLPLIPGAGGAIQQIEAGIRPPEFFVNQMRRDLTGLAAGFAVVESDATRTARAAYQALVPVGGAARNVLDPLKAIQDAMKKTADHAQRFDAALSGSVEAIARMAEYRDRLVFDIPSAGSFNVQAGLAGATAASGMVTSNVPVVNVLVQILEQLRRSPTIQVRPAALGGV